MSCNIIGVSIYQYFGVYMSVYVCVGLPRHLLVTYQVQKRNTFPLPTAPPPHPSF